VLNFLIFFYNLLYKNIVACSKLISFIFQDAFMQFSFLTYIKAQSIDYLAIWLNEIILWYSVSIFWSNYVVPIMGLDLLNAESLCWIQQE
jgi:hypothetical protein